MENKYCVTTLPKGYREIKLYDAESKKFKIFTGPVSFIVSVILAALIFFVKIGFSVNNFDLTWNPLYFLHVLTIIAFVLIYTVLHELTHGLVYKLFTRGKLKFGFNGTSAYCGVPGIYVKRNAAAVSCIAPFAVFTAVFLVLLFVLPLNVFWFVVLAAFMNHIGGCFADIYAFIVMMKKGRELLISDSGKEQRAYLPDGGKK